MKILVVGASGFLGGAIARKHLSHGHQVWGVYRQHSSKLPSGCQAVPLSNLSTLTDDFDAVVLAAGNYSISETELRAVNVELTKTVSQIFPATKLIYISSVSVYGDHNDVMDEKTSPTNPSPYGQSKLDGEAVVKKHARHAILRLTYLYGRDMQSNSFLPAIINKAKTEKLITLFGKGERLQDYLHVNDAAELVQLSVEYGENATFLGATGKSISNQGVAEIIATQIPGCKIIYSGEDSAPWFRFNPTWTQKNLKWQPIIDFSEGIKEMIE